MEVPSDPGDDFAASLFGQEPEGVSGEDAQDQRRQLCEGMGALG